MSKIIVYTINDCPFCEQEKAYLTEHTLLFEEKNIDTNRAYLTEMLAVSDNFTGVPFTVIQKDDGNKVTLKGFTKEEFDTALNLQIGGQDLQIGGSVPQVGNPPVVDMSSSQEVVPASSGGTPPLSPSQEPVIPINEPVATPPVVPPPQTQTVTPPLADMTVPNTIPSAPSPQVQAKEDHASTVVPTPTSTPASSQDGVHDQKLQEILSNLQKISRMNGQSQEPVSTPPVIPQTAPDPVVVPPNVNHDALSNQTPSVPPPFYQPPAPHVENTEPTDSAPSYQPQPIVSESVPPILSSPSVGSQPLADTTPPPPIPDFPK